MVGGGTCSRGTLARISVTETLCPRGRAAGTHGFQAAQEIRRFMADQCSVRALFPTASGKSMVVPTVVGRQHARTRWALGFGAQCVACLRHIHRRSNQNAACRRGITGAKAMSARLRVTGADSASARPRWNIERTRDETLYDLFFFWGRASTIACRCARERAAHQRLHDKSLNPSRRTIEKRQIARHAIHPRHSSADRQSRVFHDVRWRRV